MNEDLQDWILQLPNVTKASHRFGGTEFQIHGLEFMHTHGTTHLDIRLSKQDQERMLNEGKAEAHRFAPQAGWVTFRTRSDGDVETAKELIRLAYDNAEKTMAAHSTRDESNRVTKNSRACSVSPGNGHGFRPLRLESISLRTIQP